MTRSACIARILAGVLFIVMQSAPAPAQTLDEIRADVAAGDHAGAIKKIDKQLFSLSSKLTPADRYALLMIKGESKLQVKDRIGAATAFKAAAKAAENLDDLAASQANALIIDRSTSGTYRPRGVTGAEPIDIVAIDSRKRAMTALQGELWSQYKSQIDGAMEATQLPPIEKVFTHAADMFFLETYATGQAAQTGEVMRGLGTHAFKLMQSELSRCAARVEYVNQAANSASVTARGWDSGRMGLTSQQRDEMKAMLPYLAQIRDRGSEYRRIAAKMGGEPGKWDALVADTVAILADAEALYRDR